MTEHEFTLADRVAKIQSIDKLYDLENNNYTVKTTKDFIGKQISGFIFLYIILKDKNIKTEIAFN